MPCVRGVGNLTKGNYAGRILSRYILPQAWGLPEAVIPNFFTPILQMR